MEDDTGRGMRRVWDAGNGDQSDTGCSQDDSE